MQVEFILVDRKDKKDTEDLFSQIDKKIAYISTLKANNIRFGFTTSINYNLYEDLVYYREILSAKLCDSQCLCDIDLAKIISKIKSLINQTC